jgi:hypothetical protein
LRAIGLAVMIVAPRGLGGVATEVCARHVTEMTDFGPAQTAEKFSGTVDASAIMAIGEALIARRRLRRFSL